MTSSTEASSGRFSSVSRSSFLADRGMGSNLGLVAWRHSSNLIRTAEGRQIRPKDQPSPAPGGTQKRVTAALYLPDVWPEVVNSGRAAARCAYGAYETAR
jgi:hypothetical protein